MATAQRLAPPLAPRSDSARRPPLSLTSPEGTRAPHEFDGRKHQVARSRAGPLRVCTGRQVARRVLRAHHVGAAQVDVDDLVLPARRVPVQQDSDTARRAIHLVHLGRTEKRYVGPTQITSRSRREGRPQVGRRREEGAGDVLGGDAVGRANAASSSRVPARIASGVSWSMNVAPRTPRHRTAAESALISVLPAPADRRVGDESSSAHSASSV